MFGLSLGRSRWSRRRRFSLPIFLLALGVVFGADGAERWYARRQEWTGQIVKKYEDRDWWRSSRRHNGPKRKIWDVVTTDGETRSVKVYVPELWSAGRVGDPVVKHSGELDPQLAPRQARLSRNP